MAVKRAMKSAAPAAKRHKGALKSGDVSLDKMWKKPEVTKGWNARGARYWKEQAADTEGMTGGGVSRADLAFSRMAMDGLTAMLRKSGSKNMKLKRSRTKRVAPQSQERFFGRALEFGAGIGRVTNGVLRHYCRQVHLVEFMKNYLAKAKKTLPRSGCRYHFHCSSAQKYRIAAKRFDFIWCQWLLMYLTDADALDLLKRARQGLAKGGVMVVKENVMKAFKSANKYFEDGKDQTWKPGSGNGPMSLVRTRKHFESLIKSAGWHIRSKKLQVGVEGVFEDMGFWVLEPQK